MNEQSLIEEARTHAVEIIAQCVTPHGLRASALEAGYPHINRAALWLDYQGMNECGLHNEFFVYAGGGPV